MTDKPITTVSDFITWTKDLVGSFLLYRGLGDATWKVEESAAYRRVRDSRKDGASDLGVQEYVERLLNEASSAGFRDTEGKKLSDLELLAKLQHHGAATCLIDFTPNALIALWFACREEPNKPGKIVAMETGNPDHFSIIGYQDLLDKRIGELLGEKKLWKYKPSNLDNRFIAQQSVFVFGQWTVQKGFHEIIIDKNSKKEIRTELKKSFAITEEYLFGDFTGFALSNAHDKTLEYDVYTAREYLDMGAKLQQRKDYPGAIEKYDKALKLDPEYIEAYYNRGVTKRALEDHQSAIEDFNKVLELDPEYIEAYYNRGVTKRALEDHQSAIEDFNKILELDPEYRTPYAKVAHAQLSVAKKALGDIPGSVEEFEKSRAILEPILAEIKKQDSRK